MKFDKRILEDINERIALIPKKSEISPADLKKRFPDKNIFACDFPVTSAESGELSDYGIVIEGITNIDHHTPLPDMQRRITSTNLAINYIKEFGQISTNSQIVINHTDCDSMLSSMILAGYIPPEKNFGEVAISADHFGDENHLADLLQSLEQKRDIYFSATEMYNYLSGRELSGEAKSSLDKRYAERSKIQDLVDSGKFKMYNSIAYTELEKNIDAALIPAFLPEASAIVVGFPKKDSNNWNIKIRLGKKAAEGIHLNELSLPNFGGRWNAGSTGRGGGTEIKVNEYARILYHKMFK